MNDPQYQTGSSWALGGALRALGGALGSRYRRQKSEKMSQKSSQKGGAGGLYIRNPLSPRPAVVSRLRERVGVSARACEREADTTAQRAESPVEVQEQREREQKRIGMGQVSAMCARARCSRAPACTPHTQRAHARRSRALPVPHQKLGPGGRKGLLVATGHGRRRYAEAEAHCRLIYD